MKNTKILMILSSLFMGAIGGLFEFFPHEVLTSLQATSEGPMPLIVQISGALYLGFAVTNWMAKGSLIGGIYSRPLAIGNFLHFLVGALALTKFSLSSSSSTPIWLLTFVYMMFAVFFGYLFLNNPVKRIVTNEHSTS
ncbi:MAG: hypothetical protein AB7Q37_13095 [Pyrinomonadaceae bacterium]